MSEFTPHLEVLPESPRALWPELRAQQRAERKDYLDLAELLRQGVSLAQGLGAAKALYRESFNPMISLKALTYFQDGDLPTLPESTKVLLTEAASQVRSIPQIPRRSERIAAE